MNTQGREHSSQNRRNTWLLVNVVLAILLIVAGVITLFWMREQASTPSRTGSVNQQIAARHQGRTAPDFSLPTLSGEQASLNDYEGQVVLVNLWATWCPPCKAEMPTLNAFYEAHKDEGFVVLAVNNREDATTVNEYIQAQGFTFPVLLDTRAKIVDLYQVQGLPTTFIIDRDGNIQHVQIGEVSERQLESIIGPLL